MDPRLIVLMVMGVALLAWVVFCGVMAVRRLRSSASRSDLVAQATCDTCGARFDVDAAELARTFVSKSRSVTKTRRRGAAHVDEPRYRRFAKKVWCPHCGAQRWANIENVNELNERLRPELMRVGIRCLLVMAVGGFIILGAASVAMGFADRAAEARVEEARQQQRDALMEHYDSLRDAD